MGELLGHLAGCNLATSQDVMVGELVSLASQKVTADEVSPDLRNPGR